MPARPKTTHFIAFFAFLALLASGCQWYVNSADREVYHLVDKRQLQALGQEHPAPINKEHVPIKVPRAAYSYVPNPVDSIVPPEFLTTQPSTQSAEEEPASIMEPNAPAAESIKAATQPAQGQGNADNIQSLVDHNNPPVGPIPAAETNPLQVEYNPATSPEKSSNDRHEGSSPVSTHPTTQPPSGDAYGPISMATSRPSSQPAEDKSRPILTLSGALAYAFANSREFQTAKEDLYLVALALTLERHLWTPQFASNISSQYANYGEIRNFDHAMAAVAQAGVAQRLPLGGVVTARVVDNLLRDLTNHITTGETGQVILEANIPLLRGAGLVAQENLFQAERNLVYAVRTYENFRRNLAVQIAGDYFNLQQLRQAIINARESTESVRGLAARSQAFYRTGRVILLEAQRAEQAVAFAQIAEINAVETYRTSIDQFKLRIGMPTDQPIDVTLPDEPGVTTQPTSGLDDTRRLEDVLRIPTVSQQAAIDAGLKYRLDLLNDFDRIDDAARGINVAENNLLPDLAAAGSVTWDTNPNHLNPYNFNKDRATWRASLNLEIPIDRYKERNDLRSALIQKRHAQREYQAARDTVTLQVRRDIRVIEQQRVSLQIQIHKRDLAISQRTFAQVMFQKGKVSNREVTDAEAALLDARNQVAQAQSELLLAILEFRRDTGTLRVGDEGKWTGAEIAAAAAAVAATQPNG